MAEAILLSFLAPAARSLAPQVTALPPLAAYHDLRWLFAFNQSWAGFAGVLVLLLVTRSAADAVLVMLAWPQTDDPALPRPRFLASFLSCAVLTVLVWVVMSPVVTLMFGAALVPFSWPYLAAVPIMLGTALALSQGGVGQAWWRRLPPVRTAAWLLTTFAALTAASVLMTRIDAVAVVAMAGLVGIVDARAWYGLTAAAVRRSVDRPPHPGPCTSARAPPPWRPAPPVPVNWPGSAGSLRPASQPRPAAVTGRAGLSGHRELLLLAGPAPGSSAGITVRCWWSVASDRTAVTALTGCGRLSPACLCASFPTWA
jgi:hypothetical protein